MALSSPSLLSALDTTYSVLKVFHFHSPVPPSSYSSSHFPIRPPINHTGHGHALVVSEKWRTKVSFFPAFLKKGKDANAIKEELLEAIAQLDRGADATPEDQQRVDQVGWIFMLCFLKLIIEIQNFIST